MNVVRYRYRLRPGATAMAGLLAEWNRCRWVWNQAVEHLNTTGEWVRDHTLTDWRREQDWLREGSVVAQQQMLRNFRTKRAKGKGRRKFKSAKRCLPSLNYTTRGFALKDGRLCLAGGLAIPVVWSRQLPAQPSSVRVYRDNIGHWYASFVVRRGDRALPACEASIGIDWGVRAPWRRLPTPNTTWRMSQRVFVCESCGAVRDCDRNAARVILDRAGLNPAGVEAVRHSDLLEARVLAEPGISAL